MNNVNHRNYYLKNEKVDAPAVVIVSETVVPEKRPVVNKTVKKQ